jgi:type II secretory ATPase GspE/PulE/Tfp pilus assembly ATPase PilB-like protein
VLSAGELEGNLDRAAMAVSDALESGTLEAAAQQWRKQSARPIEAGSSANGALQTITDLVRKALDSRASDMHFESREGDLGRLRLRIDGVLHESPLPLEGGHAQFVRRLKLLAGMDVMQSRMPQDGRIKLSIDGVPVDLRVCALPSYYGERVTVRILRRDALLLSLEEQGFSAQQARVLRGLCAMPEGIIVANGPTGCGKTTLLYSLLRQMDTKHCNVMTVEDPVEFTFDDVSSTQIAPQLGLTFPRAIRTMLRHDPDVMLVGEIRDRETAELLVQCSLTGHLVLSSLHARTSPDALRRVIDIGILPFLVNACMLAVISQQLIRKLCPHCKQEAAPKLAELPAEAATVLRGLEKGAFFEAKGCQQCHDTGYHQRTGIREILVMNDSVRRAVYQGAEVAAIRQAAVESGMKTFLADGLEKAALGITSIEEILRVVPTER